MSLVWDVELDGLLVRASKTVQALRFSMESPFYWDRESSCLTFLQLSSNGTQARGTVDISEGQVALVGTVMQARGSVPFKQTFEAMADGTPGDRYYTGAGTTWALEPVIAYRALGDPIAQEG